MGKNAYLLAYNAGLCAGWAYVLFLTYATVLQGGDTRDVWKAVQLPLKVSQTAAVLEVVHSAIGLVRSPIAITAMQVASRLWCLWGIIVPVEGPTTGGEIPLFNLGSVSFALNLVSLLTAWCFSEVIRYGFFALKEASIDFYPATWLRYSGFLVLYPVGVASELTMAWLALPTIRDTQMWSVLLPNPLNWGFSYYVTCILIMAAYLPGLPQLYGYMLANRRKVLGAGARQAKAKAS